MQGDTTPSFDGWQKCSYCEQMFHKVEISPVYKVCPRCDFHFPLTPDERLAIIADEGSFLELFEDVHAKDLLEFRDSKPYVQRLEEAEKRTGRKNGVVAGVCKVMGKPLAIAVMDFAFMGGSLGQAEGEKIACITEHATKNRLPLTIVCASGGARMQESMYSLLQMAKTSAALKKHSQEGLFYLSVLTHPTMGGVSASFAFLGDVIIAEPKALIGFTGPRVIEQTIGQKLKKEDQRSEFQLELGMIDQIVAREDLKKKISYFINMFERKGMTV